MSEASETARIATTFERDNPQYANGKMVEVVPDPSTLWKLGQIKSTIEETLAELTDNSIDAIKRDTVHISVLFENLDGGMDSQAIEVEDNGTGMTADQARDALVLGKSNKTNKDIGKFGFGLKRAGTFLGKRIIITTATDESQDATVIVYDEDDFGKDGTWYVPMYTVPNPFRAGHGTIVRIEKLKVNLKGHGRGATVGNTPIDRFKKLMSRQHRLRLNKDVFITVDHTSIRPHHPTWDHQWDAVRQEFDLDVNGKRVHGIVGVAEDLAGRNEDFGLDLMRHNRIVAEFDKLGRAVQNHPMYRNVYGVIHLDDFEVTNDKTGFRTDNDDWGDLEKAMIEVMKPIRMAVTEWYAGPTSPSKLKKADPLKDQFILEVIKGEDGKIIDVEWVLPGYVWVDGEGWVPKPAEELEGDNSPGNALDSGASDFPAGGDSQDGRGNQGNGIFVRPTDDQGAEQGLGAGWGDKVPPVTLGEGSGGSGGTGSLDPVGRGRGALGIVLPPAGRVNQFEGEYGDLRYRHEAVHEGGDGRYQSSTREEDEEGTVTLVVTTDLEHPGFFRTDPARWFRHNVAEALTEYLLEEGKIDLGQFVSAKNAILVDMLKSLQGNKK